MADQISVEVEAILEAELAKLQVNCNEAGWRTALKVARTASENAERETGSMADSCYATSGDGRSTYGDAVGAALGDNPRVVILPEEPPYQGIHPSETQMQQGVAESVAAVAAKHGFMVENGYGPEGRRPAKPFFEPATAEAEQWYLDELESLEK